MSWRLNHPGTCVSRWSLQGAAGVITPDVFGRYPGTLVNAPTWGVGPKNSLSAIELDGGTQYVNLGDITQLNAVSAFTLCWWMAQDVISVSDIMFWKYQDVDNNIQVDTSPANNLIFRIENGGTSYGYFDYRAAISAGSWRHVAMVYDGTQAANASRLVVYVSGAPITLLFSGTIPAITADLSGFDAVIGHTAVSFDGRLWDFRLFNVPLSRDEVNKIIHQPAPLV